MKKKLTLICIVLIAASASLGAIELESMCIRSNGYIFFNQTSDNAPYVFTNGLGVAFTISLGKNIALEPALDFFTNYYGISVDDGRPLPVDESERYIYMVQLILDPAFVFRIVFSETLELKLLVSPSFIFSFPLRAWDDGEDYYPDTFAYLYGALRFLQPMFGAALMYQVTPKIALDVRAKVYIPVCHLWDGEGQQFQDQMKVGVSLGVQYDL